MAAMSANINFSLPRFPNLNLSSIAMICQSFLASRPTWGQARRNRANISRVFSANQHGRRQEQIEMSGNL